MTNNPSSNHQVYALQTEALLKLLRHQEAYATYEKMPKFDHDWCNKLFGADFSAYFLMIGAQIYLATGRLVKMLYFDVFNKLSNVWHLMLTKKEH